MTDHGGSEPFKKITLKDIARATGVSYATVSAVLRRKTTGTIRVSDQTRKEILKAARKMGYVPNLLARALKGGKNSLIVVFTFEKVFPVDARNEYYPFFVGIEEEAEKQGFDLLILNNRPLDEESTSKFSRILMADGAIMIGVHRVEERLKSLIDRNFPIVFVGRREIKGCETNWVTFDYRTIIHSLLDYLSSEGVKSFLYVKSQTKAYEPYSDREVFLKEAAGLKGMEMAGIVEMAEAGTVKKGIKSLEGAEAVVFDRITTALSIQEEKEAPGIPPERILILEDNWTGQPVTWTHWTSERQRLGTEAVKLLVQLIDGTEDSPVHRMIPLQMIPFKS
ncbi:MAG: LacI family DNA-binding transcriptional regulator [Spirochaetales bacterium]|nr:LacI family DNA-binding transcriptional regulator [Spirochaetales bacterium]